MIPAQAGGHKHMAEVANNSVLLSPRISPWLNTTAALPTIDGKWNNGEAFPFDVGGVLGPDPAPAAAVQYAVQLQGWTAANAYHQDYVGQMRGSPENESTHPLAALTGGYAASFKISAPLNTSGFASRPYTIVILSVAQTSRSVKAANIPYDPYIYPGDKDDLGLWAPPFPSPPDMVDHFVQNPASSDSIVFGAFYVPRGSARPLTFAYQRLRQLREIVKARLQQDFNRDPTKMVFLVAGGSFGSLVTQTALILHPDEFHGGVASGYSAVQRSVANDQESYRFFISLLGRDKVGSGYSLFDAMDWSIFYANEGTDAVSLSFANRMRLGQIKRPCFLLCGDEDPVSTGQEWVAPLANAAHSSFGQLPLSTPTGASVRWSTVGKACHGDGEWGEPWYIAGEPGLPPHHKIEDAVKFMVPVVRNEAGTSQSPPPLKVTNSLGNSMELHDQALTRKGTRVVPTGSNPNLLSEAPETAFKRYGQGTWLGAGDSLRVAKASPNDALCSIYAGSAEGMVYRFDRTVVAGIEPTFRRIAGHTQLAFLQLICRSGHQRREGT